MKYLWIIIIAIFVLVWSIASIIDIIDTFSFFKFKFAFDHLQEYSAVWLALVVFGIFIYSFMLYVGVE